MQTGMKPVGHSDERAEEAERDDALQCEKDFRKARQRVELLQEERQLQQALIDTFDS